MKINEEKLKMLQVKIPGEIFRMLKIEAIRQSKKMYELVNQIFQEWLTRNKK